MSLMQEWIKLFPNGKPRSSDNAVAGEHADYSLTVIKSPWRGSDDWAYDPWDETTQYSSKGMESDLAWMGGLFNDAQTHATYADGILQDLNNTAAGAQGGLEAEKASEKRTKITEGTRRTTSLTKQTMKFRALTVNQITAGYAASIAGLTEYDSITLAEFKVL